MKTGQNPTSDSIEQGVNYAKIGGVKFPYNEHN